MTEAKQDVLFNVATTVFLSMAISVGMIILCFVRILHKNHHEIITTAGTRIIYGIVIGILMASVYSFYRTFVSVKRTFDQSL